MESEHVNIKWANFLLPNKRAFYDHLIEKHFFLPKFESKACSSEYLMRCARKEIFTINDNQITVYHLKRKATKAELITILSELPRMDLGFDITNPPDKEFLQYPHHMQCSTEDAVIRDLPKG
jgi:hypothetical protein